MPASDWPRLRSSSSRRASPMAVVWLFGSSLSTHARGSGGASGAGDPPVPVSTGAPSAVVTSARAAPKVKVSTSYALANFSSSPRSSLRSTPRSRSTRGTVFIATALPASSDWSSPLRISSTPCASAARFKSAVSKRGSAIFILALLSMRLISVRRIVPSMVKASTGRKRMRSSSVKSSTRRVVSTRRRAGETHSRVSRQ